MRSFLKFFSLFIILVGIVVVYASMFIVDERNSALVIRLGQIQKSIDAPGIHFKYPFFEEHVYIPKHMIFIESQDKSVQVVDRRIYVVDAITMFRITDPKQFRLSFPQGLNSAQGLISRVLDSALGQTYGKRTFDAALSEKRAEMMREIRDEVKKNVEKLGIEIVDVRIRRTDLSKQVLNDTFERMKAERFAQAEQLRAFGRTQKERIEAEANREAIELVANAQKEAEIIRGQGDADRNKTFADAFSKDPEFFAFYRSMQAYPRALDGQGTTMVLSPNSEFFKYLKEPGKAKE